MIPQDSSLHAQLDVLENCARNEEAEKLSPARRRQLLSETYTLLHGQAPKADWLDQALQQKAAPFPSVSGSRELSPAFWPTSGFRLAKFLCHRSYVRPTKKEWEQRSSVLERVVNFWDKCEDAAFMFMLLGGFLLVILTLGALAMNTFPIWIAAGVYTVYGLNAYAVYRLSRMMPILRKWKRAYSKHDTDGEDWARMARWPLVAQRIQVLMEEEESGASPILKGDVDQMWKMMLELERRSGRSRIKKHLKKVVAAHSDVQNPVPCPENVFGDRPAYMSHM